MTGLEWSTWLLLGLSTFFGASSQGLVGFGLAFTLVTLLAVVERLAIPTMPLILALPMVLGNFAGDLRDLDVRGSALIILGRLPGTVIGAGLLALVATDVLGVVVGIALLVSIAAGLRTVPRLTDRSWIAAGVISGVMGTAAGLGGPR